MGVFPESRLFSGQGFTEQELITPISKERVEVIRDQLLAVTKTTAVLGAAAQLGLGIVAARDKVFLKTPDGRQQDIKGMAVNDRTSAFAADLFEEGIKTQDPNSIQISWTDGHISILRISSNDRVNPQVVDIWYSYGGLYFQGRNEGATAINFRVSTFHEENPRKHLQFNADWEDRFVMTLTQAGRKDKALDDALRNLWNMIGQFKDFQKRAPMFAFRIDLTRSLIDKRLLRALSEIECTMTTDQIEALRADLERENGLTREQFFAQILAQSKLRDSWRRWISRLDNQQAESISDFVRARIVFSRDTKDIKIDTKLSADMQHLQDAWLKNVKSYLEEDWDEFVRIAGSSDVDEFIKDTFGALLREFTVPWMEYRPQLQALLANGIAYSDDPTPGVK